MAFSRRIRKLLIEECSLSDSEIPPSKIVRTVERISQTELLPIIQSHVSRHMNDIQSDASYFCPPQKGTKILETNLLSPDILYIINQRRNGGKHGGRSV